MKIIIINGSPRPNGSTARILTIIGNYLQAKNDVEVAFYNLSELELAFCKGCCYCFEKGNCIMDDDIEKLSNEIVKADGIIMGTPTYESNISGQLKTFADRGHLIMEQSLNKKYAIGVITSENYGGSKAATILKNILSYSGAYISAMIQHKLPFSNSPQFEKPFVTRFERSAERFYQDIKHKRKYFLQGILHYAIFNIGIKPFVLSKGDRYKGVAERWNVENKGVAAP